MGGEINHWTVESLKGLRELQQICKGDLDAIARISGIPRLDINRALDAMLGRESEEELAHAVTWLSGGLRSPKPENAVGGGQTKKERLPRFLRGLLR
jgi:hypothetical protein